MLIYYTLCLYIHFLVPEVESQGGVISYPVSEVTGQLYAHQTSQNVAMLFTRGLLEDGVNVGVFEGASGMYVCEAVNDLEKSSETVTIDVANG